MLGSVMGIFIYCLGFRVKKLLLKLREQMFLESSFSLRDLTKK